MDTKKIVILTGNMVRHGFFRKAFALADGVEVLRTYCEDTSKNIVNVIKNHHGDADIQHRHIEARDRCEADFFGAFNELVPDRSNAQVISFGDINSPEVVGEIKALDPDLVVVYGSGLIKDPLIELFPRRILNVHLGLSPHYRGCGTNFWPLVNDEPEYVGCTFMYLDAGIDTGEIIHQLRARVLPGDTPHTIGNRLIAEMVPVYIELVRRIDDLGSIQQIPIPEDAKLYFRKDFSPESVKQLYRNFEDGMIDRYLAEFQERARSARILNHPIFGEGDGR